MVSFSISALAFPTALILISFLSFSSQYLFVSLEPLSRDESIVFNINIACLLISYFRAVLTDPGRIPFSKKDDDNSDVGDAEQSTATSRQRWCRKCEQRKPPRTHHCKVCKRCIPKMDHHCPWTCNCVSHRSYPHFLRFIFYSVSAMSILEYHLFMRAAVLFRDRALAYNLGPSVLQLTHLFVLLITNSVTLLALALLLSTAVWSLAWNTTMIEGWEIERHETLLRRARHTGGFLDGPDGMKVQIRRQEFPYDIGIWENLKQGMGTGNILAWFWPFSTSPDLSSGVVFETNGMEDPSIGWPPPDPDRIPRLTRSYEQQSDMIGRLESSSGNEIEEFRKRQQVDMLRRRQLFHQRYDEHAIRSNDTSAPNLYVEGAGRGEESWKTAEGEGLAEFGADEEVEFYDEDVPLSELLEKRRQANHN